MTPTAHQLAFLACRSNGLSQLFEDTALSQLEALKAAGQLKHLSNPIPYHISTALQHQFHHADCKSDESLQSAASKPRSVADSLNALLQQQVQAVREAEQQRAVEEMLYIWCLHKLAEGGMAVTTSFAAETPSDEQVRPLIPTSTLLLSVQPAMFHNSSRHGCF